MEDEITIVLLSVLLGICIGFELTKHPKNIKKYKNILVEDFRTTFSWKRSGFLLCLRNSYDYNFYLYHVSLLIFLEVIVWKDFPRKDEKKGYYRK